MTDNFNDLFKNENNTDKTVPVNQYQPKPENFAQTPGANTAYNPAGVNTQPPVARPVTPYTPDNGNTEKPKKQKKSKNGVSKGFVAFMLILCIILSSALGFGGAWLCLNYGDSQETQVSENGALVIKTANIDEQTASKLSDKSTSQIADEVADTVVEITTESMTTSLLYGQYISQGAGSGVIISSDGYIVTNNHVIEGASSITVTLRDKTTYTAELVGTDSVIDIALLKIDAKDLKAATFGDSSKLKVGDKAVAIGNPLGQLGGTVTDGIISALDRDVVVDNETMHLLQTDTAINPGNSGGGLFDGQGILIGIVVAKQTGAEIEGLGFAVPINDVIEILDDLKEYGYVTGRVALGVELMDISNSLFSMYYYGTDESGCYVHSVVRDSAAYNAGIKEGDRIVSIDGTEITCVADVESILDDKEVGDKIKVEIERDNETAEVTVKLEEYVPEDVQYSDEDDDVPNPFD